MIILVRLNRLIILVLSIDVKSVVASSFLPDEFASWFWQSCKYILYVTRVTTTKNDSAALVVDKWLYIDGGEIWAKWGGSNTIPSGVWST